MLTPEVTARLQAAVGSENVLMEKLDRLVYGYDSSFRTRLQPAVPDAVVRPPSAPAVAEVMRIARAAGVPVTPRSAGTGQAGAAVAVQGGIVLDMLALNRLLELDLDNLQIIVEPGMVHAQLNDLLRPHGFFFPVDPGSSRMCTLGGMVANNSSGMRAVKYGTTRHYVLGLEVVMPDGTLLWTGGQHSRALKSVSGYDLTQLLVGSEGTLGIFTKIRLKVVPLPERRGVVFAAFADLKALGLTVVELFRRRAAPSAIEVLDRSAIGAVNLIKPEANLPDVEGILMLEVDGSAADVPYQAEKCAQVCRGRATDVRWTEDPQEIQQIWSGRQVAGAAAARVMPGGSRVYDGEDIGLPISRVPEALQALQAISREHGLPIVTYGHVGDGNLHAAIVADFRDPARVAQAQVVADAIHRLALRLQGTTTAEHGVGLSRAGYMAEEHGPALAVMRAIKQALDPQNLLNPGKMALTETEQPPG